jgi:hypothetical protein
VIPAYNLLARRVRPSPHGRLMTWERGDSSASASDRATYDVPMVDLAALLRGLRDQPDGGAGLLGGRLSHEFEPPRPDELEALASRYDLPPDVMALWTAVGSGRLFEDGQFGQWGLSILTPAAAESEMATLRRTRPDDVLQGDLTVANLIGDAQAVVVRCDRLAADFGEVLVALPMDARRWWPLVGETLAAFISQFVAVGGEQFWPH